MLLNQITDAKASSSNATEAANANEEEAVNLTRRKKNSFADDLTCDIVWTNRTN